jgi:hypothetical protein
LTTLFLDSNHLTKTIPTSFSILTKMRYFDVHINMLTGEIPVDVIRHWTQMRFFRIDDNMFSKSLPVELGKLSEMHFLSAYQNDLTGELLINTLH